MTTGVLASQVNVTAAATQIVAAGAGRLQLRLRWPNNAGQVGPAFGPTNTVTQATGYRPILSPQGPNGAQEYVIPTNGPLWGIMPQGTSLRIDVLEVYS